MFAAPLVALVLVFVTLGSGQGQGPVTRDDLVEELEKLKAWFLERNNLTPCCRRCEVATCGRDFPFRHGNSCYFFGNSSKTFDDAKAACEALGAKLAEVETAEENEYLKTLARQYGQNGHVWLGGSDRENEGSFVWVSDNRPVTFSDWAERQPDNWMAREDCMYLWYTYQYHWNDGRCWGENRFICEASL